MIKKRLEINFEQREVWRISHSNKSETAHCPVCGDVSQMIAAEKLALLAEISPREIYRKIEQGELHFVETSMKQVLVCLASFTNSSFLMPPSLKGE
jgi:hypothetical protein